MIIQRIKIIQNYVKKNISRFKNELGGSPDRSRNDGPVILNSIHNDGMSLELKIKDILKVKMETIEQRVKTKEEKMVMLEVNLNRQEKKFNDTITAVSDATQQEFDKVQNQIFQLVDKFDQEKSNINVIRE